MKLSPLTEEFLDYVVAALIVAFLAFAWWAITDAVENPVQAEEYIMKTNALRYRNATRSCTIVS